MGALALTGCGLSSGNGISTATSVPVVTAVITGKVYGGQQAIGGATIQLYAAGTANYGVGATYSSGTSLLGTNTSTTATDGTGSFSLKNGNGPLFTCPGGNPNVYLVATGGSPSTGNTLPANNQLALMAALGPCQSIGSSTKVVINEITTVASVYALSGFMTNTTNIGTSSTNVTGLNNAFAAVNKLANIASGGAGGPALPANATLPVAKINTLANILAACVNSAGGTVNDGSGSTCSHLFQYTTVNGVAPTDTITAVMNMAQHPNLNAASLWGLPTGSAPFQPSLASLFPADLSVVVTYSGGGLSTPKGIAVDNADNVWTANSGNNSVSEFSNTGAAISGPTGYAVGASSAPAAIAIDASGNAWVANSGNSTVSEISPNGATVTAFSGGSLSSPVGVAIDASSNVWVANSGGGGSVTEISPGTTAAYANYTGAGIAAPAAIAINPK
jgi:DNA-binding beta-propeller fold protein YncE